MSKKFKYVLELVTLIIVGLIITNILYGNELRDRFGRESELLFGDLQIDQERLDTKVNYILSEFESYDPYPPAEEFVYIVKDGNIQNEDIEPTDQILWDVFKKIAADKELVNSVSEIRIFGSNSQELDDTVAFVIQNSSTGNDWILGINYDAVTNDRETILTFIHEYMHMETLQDLELTTVLENPLRLFGCSTLQISEGCLNEDSVLYEWYKEHWLSNNLTFSPKDSEDTVEKRYKRNKQLFINDYAATDVLEDFAETFAYWVLDERGVPESKRKYLESNPELKSIKQQIRFTLVK